MQFPNFLFLSSILIPLIFAGYTDNLGEGPVTAANLGEGPVTAAKATEKPKKRRIRRHGKYRTRWIHKPKKPAKISDQEFDDDFMDDFDFDDDDDEI